MSTTEHPTIGRPRSFDEEAVLDELTALFWRQGYSKTSMTDIVEASGVHKPSLYRTFGTKDELFATVLRRYLSERADELTQLIETAGPGIEGIHTFLDLFEANAVSGPGKDGCLMVMASNELRGTTPGYEDFATDYRRVLQEKIGRLVANAHPDTDPSLIEQRTDLFSSFFLGLQVTIRSGASPDVIRRFVDAMKATVDTW